MDDRWLTQHPAASKTVERRYGEHGPKYIDVQDFLDHEFIDRHQYKFPMESFPKLKRQYTITMLEKHEDYAVFDVDVLLISGDRETTAKHRVYLTIRPWEGMEEILGENPFTVQHEGKSNALKQLNSGTYAFSKFFGLCHCDILIG